MENQLFYRQIYYTIWKPVMWQVDQWNVKTLEFANTESVR